MLQPYFRNLRNKIIFTLADFQFHLAFLEEEKSTFWLAHSQDAECRLVVASKGKKNLSTSFQMEGQGHPNNWEYPVLGVPNSFSEFQLRLSSQRITVTPFLSYHARSV